MQQICYKNQTIFQSSCQKLLKRSTNLQNASLEFLKWFIVRTTLIIWHKNLHLIKIENENGLGLLNDDILGYFSALA